VVAVDWDYIFLRETSKLFSNIPRQRKSISSWRVHELQFGKPQQAHLELFTTNCFNYLLEEYNGKQGYYWNYAPNLVITCPERPMTDQLLVAVPSSVKWKNIPAI